GLPGVLPKIIGYVRLSSRTLRRENSNRDLDKTQILFGELQKHFLCISKSAEKLQTKKCLPRVSPKAAAYISYGFLQEDRNAPRKHLVSPQLASRYSGRDPSRKESRTG